MPTRFANSAEQEKNNTDAFADEAGRVSTRRKALGLNDADDARGSWGLALSGGGIRSATCSLGVLQALATSKRPSADPAAAADNSLLREFDYVSSVSGGGYIASFFISLFVPGRLREKSDSKTAASDAYKVLQYEPPGRLRRREDYSTREAGEGPMGWLRDNGRYLAPTGGGDLTYAAALTIRNWFSVQYVLGTLLIAVLSLLALIRGGVAVAWQPYADVEQWLLVQAQDGKLWWSPVWILPLACIFLWLAPFATAYWLTHAREGESDSSKPQSFSLAACYALLLGLSFSAAALAVHDWRLVQWQALPWLLATLGAIALLAFAVHALSAPRAASISAHRVLTTRGLTAGLQFLITLSVIALADTLGQHLYLLATAGEFWKSLTPGALAGALVWLFRRMAGFFDEKKASGWVKALPMSLLAGLAGVVLLLLIITVWAVFVQWVQWTGLAPDDALIRNDQRLAIIAGMFVIFLMLSLTAGRFSGFLNLSTLQNLYGARLTRAYLGASNGKRFVRTDSGSNRSVAEPIEGDQIAREKYYGRDVLAPVHIINVTLNQTIDPAEQLVQRDRKGKPMAIVPAGFFVEGDHFTFRDHLKQSINSGRGSQQFTVGQWIGVSGAAFTTGLGRSTSLGVSLALGLSNVRLGMWWSSGYGRDAATGLEKWFKSAFRTQAFLIYEMLAKFHGLRREWQYLSDGGHYENTAVYELLRSQRDVKLIVVCDNGCDPDYQFGDLANLIRLARIDFRMQIEVDEQITRTDSLNRYFGTPTDFGKQQASNEKCALLLNVFRHGSKAAGKAPDCRIILLKPRLLDSMSVDLREYNRTHPEFPQEPTADQFFDEAQWESYRGLGYCIGRRIFGSQAQNEVGEALWEYLDEGTRQQQAVDPSIAPAPPAYSSAAPA